MNEISPTQPPTGPPTQKVLGFSDFNFMQNCPNLKKFKNTP